MSVKIQTVSQSNVKRFLRFSWWGILISDWFYYTVQMILSYWFENQRSLIYKKAIKNQLMGKDPKIQSINQISSWLQKILSISKSNRRYVVQWLWSIYTRKSVNATGSFLELKSFPSGPGSSFFSSSIFGSTAPTPAGPILIPTKLTQWFNCYKISVMDKS